MVTIAIDVMGGDNYIKEPILGIIEAINQYDDLKIIAVGNEKLIKEELLVHKFSSDRLSIVHTEEVITTSESPVNAVKRKKNSSLITVVKLVKEKKADCCISAGNSGAYMVAAQAYLKRTKGVLRPPLAPILPTIIGEPAVLVDCGANIDARAEHLLNFAKLGSIYLEEMCGVESPKVAILNIGEEEEKGNKLVKEAYPLLKSCKDINFIGSIEPRDLISGKANVIVCDAFVGNSMLKLLEGILQVGKSLLKDVIYSSIKSKIGGLLLKKSLKSKLSQFDVSKYGGALLLGLDGLVVKCHGNAKKKEFFNTIVQSRDFINKKINDKIRKIMEENDETR